MKLQTIVALVLLVSMMFGAGLQTDRSAFRAVATEWGVLLRALAANFIIVPLVAVLIARSFRLPNDAATGLLLMAIAPGVPFLVLSAGRKKGGSHELAIALSLLMPALSTLTIPISLELVLPAADRPDITAGVIVPLLAFQLVPLVAGLAVAQWLPRIAERLLRPLGIVTLVAFLAILAMLIPAIVRGVISVFGEFGLLAMFVTVALSFAIGWALGGPLVQYRRTVAAGTALRNPAVAMLLATASFGGTGAAAAVAAYFIIQVVVASVAGALLAKGPAEPNVA
jgi:BASS family bile acid:Na+ symporter